MTAVRYNHWSLVSNKIETTIHDSGTCVLFNHNSAEFEEIVFFLKKLPITKNVLYISLMRTYESIKSQLKEVGKHIYFVDCVSGDMFSAQSDQNCVYAICPFNLEQLHDLITKIAQRTRSDYIIVDSVSQLANLADDATVEAHFNPFIAKIRFTLPQFAKLLLMYDTGVGKSPHIDLLGLESVLSLEVIRGNVKWKG